MADYNFPLSEEILPAVGQIKEIQILQKSVCSKSFLVCAAERTCPFSKEKIICRPDFLVFFIFFTDTTTAILDLESLMSENILSLQKSKRIILKQ